jgi:hypothetical protein
MSVGSRTNRSPWVMNLHLISSRSMLASIGQDTEDLENGEALPIPRLLSLERFGVFQSNTRPFCAAVSDVWRRR